MATERYGCEGEVMALYAEKFDFGAWLLDRARSTPWWILSVAAHAVLIMVFMALTFSNKTVTEAQVAELYTLNEAPLLEAEKRPELNSEMTPDDSQEFVERPLDTEFNKVAQNNETDNNQEFKEMRTEVGKIDSDSPLKGQYQGDTIGLGGGAGGFSCRDRGGKMNGIAKNGGDPKTEGSVWSGLKWLARHQNSDGGWGAGAFKHQCKDTICEGEGSAEYDTGVTGLALLAFLGAGYTQTSREMFEYQGKTYLIGTVVKDALRWLIRNQDAEGCFGAVRGGKFMYNHCIATLAMCEGCGLTKSPLLRESAQRGIQFLLAAQNPYKAWRYGVRPPDNDTSVTGWAVMALKSAQLAELEVGRSGYDGAKAWLDEVTDDTYYKVGYTAKNSGKVVVLGKNENWGHHEALTAVGMMCRIFIDKDKTDPRLKGGAELLLQDLPVWDNSNAGDKKVDLYYWYYGTLALFQYDGPDGKFWKGWNEAMKKALVPNQKTKKDGCADGSWDPAEDRWGFEGGRVYTTAINTLTLEIYYRYDSVFGAEKHKAAK